MNLIPDFKALFNKKEEGVFWVADVFQLKKKKKRQAQQILVLSDL